MKKILSLIIALICLVPNIVKADMGAPEIRPYEMIVVSENGVKYYDNHNEKGVIPKDEKFKVEFEYDGNYTITYKNESYEIYDLSGAILVEDKFDPEKTSDESLYRTTAKVLINTTSVDMLKGPASAYDKIGSIKEGEIAQGIYKLGGSKYVYVEYKGKKGWIDYGDEKALIANSDKYRYVFRKDYHIACATIPKNTVLTPDYFTDTWSGKAQFTYENCTDLVSTFKSDVVLEIHATYAKALKDMIIYENGDNGGKKLATIPKGKKFIYIASGEYYDEVGSVFVKYNDVRGWVEIKYDDYDLLEEKVSEKDVLTEEELGKVKEEKEEKKETKKDSKKSTKKVNVKDYTLMYAIIGGSVALAAIIIIILINKNKKLKKQLKEDEVKLNSVTPEETLNVEETKPEKENADNNSEN